LETCAHANSFPGVFCLGQDYSIATTPREAIQRQNTIQQPRTTQRRSKPSA